MRLQRSTLGDALEGCTAAFSHDGRAKIKLLVFTPTGHIAEYSLLEPVVTFHCDDVKQRIEVRGYRASVSTPAFTLERVMLEE